MQVLPHIPKHPIVVLVALLLCVRRPPAVLLAVPAVVHALDGEMVGV
jgi:hypothetical protein